MVTFRPSRAWVQSACRVYMALPSASRQTTGRSGQAMAAPVASGRPQPMAPPVTWSQLCGRAFLVMREEVAADAHRFVGDDRALGQRAGERCGDLVAGKAPVGAGGGSKLATAGASRDRAEPIGEPLERIDQIVLRARQGVDGATLRRQQAGLAGIGEERGRLAGADQDDVAKAGELVQRLVDRIAQAVDRHPAGAALDPAIAHLGERHRTGRRGDPAGGRETRARSAPPRS